MEQYRLQRETLEKEKIIDMQFQSTYEKERIDSNQKISSSGGNNKRDLSAFKNFSDNNQQPYFNDFKTFKKGIEEQRERKERYNVNGGKGKDHLM